MPLYRKESPKSERAPALPISPVRLIILLGVGIFILRLLVLDVMRVEGHSMEPTLLPNQVIFVNRVAYGLLAPFVDRYIARWQTPVPGDVVVLPSPTQSKILVKRCVAREGDRLTISSGALHINRLNMHLSPESAAKFSVPGEIPQGQVLVLGDNLHNSVDSRNFGLISVDKIIGKVIGAKGARSLDLQPR